MNAEYDPNGEARFEEYLRQFRPTRTAAELHPIPAEARPRRRPRYMRAVLGSGVAAATLLCLAFFLLPAREEPVRRRVGIVPPAPVVQAPVIRTDEQVRYGTLLAATTRGGPEALGQLLDDVSPLLLASSRNNQDLTAAHLLNPM